MVVVWLVLGVDESHDGDDDDVMNDTIMPNDGQLWAMFALLPNFDTLDDPKQTANPNKKKNELRSNRTGMK